MSYVVHVWQAAAGESAPADVYEAMQHREDAWDRAEAPCAEFATLLTRLTCRYPDITSTQAKSLPENELAWTDGPLTAGSDPVLVLGLTTSMCDQVRPFVIEQAQALGLLVADDQAGEAYLPGGVVLSVAAAGCAREAHEGSVTAMRDFAQRLVDGRGVRKDLGEAANWFGKAAKGGDAEAQFKFGLMFDNGTGVKRDAAEAVQWFLRAAEQGHSGGQYELAVRLSGGVPGVAADPAEAFRWCSLAAAQGDGFALRVLGQMHQAGHGTAVDVAAAIRCYREAAQRGSQLARMSLGALYREGIGVPQDQEEAERIYKEGARAGEASSMSSWALMLNRTGRPEYQPLMLALRIRAAEIDPARHAGLLEILRENMPRTTIDDAEQLAKEKDIVAAVEKRLRAA